MSQAILESVLPTWYELLKKWSLQGALNAAATEALGLSGDQPLLNDYITQWSGGDFNKLPPIVLLSSADIGGAMGAYAASTDTIYLNEDWMATATQEQIIAVLTEELGHFLDDQLNLVDTPGDEGEYFSHLIRGQSFPASEKLFSRSYSDSGTITILGSQVESEFALLSTTPNYVLDPSANALTWGGTDTDDILAFQAALSPHPEFIIGYGGYDVLLLDFFGSEVQLETNQTGITYIRTPLGSICPVQIEKIDLKDASYTIPLFPSESVLDPSANAVTWGGTDADDILVFQAALSPHSEVIDGYGGYDVLSLEYKKNQVIVSINASGGWDIRTPTGDIFASNIEAIGFADSLLVLQSRVAIRGNSIYTIVDGPSWTQAETNAGKLGGHLVSVNDSNENDFIWKYFLLNASTQAWIGCSDQEEEGIWRWSSGEEFSYTPYGTLSFGDNAWGGQDFGKIVYGGLWDDVNPQPTFSAGPDLLNGISESRFIRRGDSAYVVVRGPTWAEAQSNAIKLGGNLVTISDSDEYSWLMSQYANKSLASVFIGLNSLRQEGSWEWVNGETSGWDVKWFIGQPSNSYGGNDEDYAELVLLDLGWSEGPSIGFVNDTSSAVKYASYGIAEIKLAPNNPATGTPILTGIFKVSQSISIDPSGIQDVDNFTGYTPNYNYAWEVSSDNGATWTPMTSADAIDNNSTYVLTAAEVGKKVRGVVSYVDGYGTIESLPTTASAAVIPNNQAPTSISFSNTSFNENIPASSVVADLSSTDPDAADSFTYELVSGTGSGDNPAFSILGSQLKINGSPNFESKPFYSIRIRTSDSGGLSFEKEVVLNVLNLQELGAFGDITSSSSGSFVEGVTLKAGTLSDPDNIVGGVTYKWFKDGVLSGASDSYLVGPMGGGVYRVDAIYVDGTNSTITASSTTQTVDKINNGSGVVGAITSNSIFQPGALLTAPIVAQDPDGTASSYTYAWFRSGTATPIGTASTYQVTTADVGKTLSVQITYKDAQLFDNTVTTDSTPIITPVPKLIGDANSNPDLVGTETNDRMSGQGVPTNGLDVLDGRSGVDTVYESGDYNFTISGSPTGSSTLVGSTTQKVGTKTVTTVFINDSMTSIEVVEVTGGASANTITTQSYSGQTTMNGAGGNDILIGGTGVDWMTGGTGGDFFRFAVKPSSLTAATADHITDFKSAESDKVQVVRTAFGISSTAKVSFTATSTTQSLAQALLTTNLFVLDSATGNLYYNDNGSATDVGTSGGVFAVLEKTNGVLPAFSATNLALI